MRIACIGGGPGGVFFATLIKQEVPESSVVVFERNSFDNTFGFGVVFSDATLSNLGSADHVLSARLAFEGQEWDEIELRLRGEVFRCGGNGMVAIARKELLGLLYKRALEVGVDLRFETAIESLEDVDGFDLVVGSDGINSLVRRVVFSAPGPSIEVARAKFIWFGTTYKFRGLTFIFEESQHGVFAVHGYPIDESKGTFIVETDEETWKAAGMDRFDVSQPPGLSDMFSKQYLESLFAPDIDGAGLLVNNSRWANFRTIRNPRWHSGKYVLLGDSAHTAHFSVGSGTKMAMEDAAALAECLVDADLEIETALNCYEERRRPNVDGIQGSAVPSLSWWENFGRNYAALEPTQFAYHFFTRSISGERLKKRDPAFVREVAQWWEKRFGAGPCDSRLELGGLTIERRVAEVLSSSGVVKALLDTSNGVVSISLSPYPWGGLEAGFGALLEIGASNDSLAEAELRLEELVAAGPMLVAVTGGTAFERRFLAEKCRVSFDVVSMVIEREWNSDAASTLLLSGRSDLIGILR